MSIGSGSCGNSYYIGTGSYGILIDAGIPVKTIRQTLKKENIPFESICAVFVDNLERIDTVAEGLGHLATLRVTNQTVDQYCMERALACLLNTREYHTDYPEEDDIVTCYENICRVEVL